jgi:hypothetical protein
MTTAELEARTLLRLLYDEIEPFIEHQPHTDAAILSASCGLVRTSPCVLPDEARPKPRLPGARLRSEGDVSEKLEET